ncbi:uncharacterized protein LOC120270869 [Dioscorea cayenensis subsp. rotundata]|uniref:Uncharacterized protein LOC120270869 n=1 Tax=Dioscorea cayennensis subsp. rotundata TaxID=55577 RepID=A0AB40C516_DIOCR|nr:uncharacterized protein LOC120270869 [Dioscorea cayenensis subsp. rotundata]
MALHEVYEGRYAEGKRSRGIEDYEDISQSPVHTPTPSVFTPNDSRQQSPTHETEDDDIMQVEPPSSQPWNPHTQSSSNEILRELRDQDGHRRKRERKGKKLQDSSFNMDKYIAIRECENKEYLEVLKGTQVVEKHTIEDCMKVFNEMSGIFTEEEMFKATQIFIKDKSYRELFLCLQENHKVPWLKTMFSKIE